MSIVHLRGATMEMRPGKTSFRRSARVPLVWAGGSRGASFEASGTLMRASGTRRRRKVVGGTRGG